jgi:hypothetical protein
MVCLIFHSKPAPSKPIGSNKIDIAHILTQEYSERAERNIRGDISITICGTGINLGFSIESSAMLSFVELGLKDYLDGLVLPCEAMAHCTSFWKDLWIG